MKTKEERVALAKDVLKQLDEKKLIAIHGTYVDVFYNASGTQVCAVCGLGSLVVACCGVSKEKGMGGQEVFECLKDVFEPEQVMLIEAAFEADSSPPIRGEYRSAKVYEDILNNAELSMELAAASDMFPTEYNEETGENKSDPEEALMGIMENIIRNGGDFVVEVE